MKEEDKEYNIDEWKTKFSAAELAAKFMFAMSYYHERMKLHIMLHPLFFLAGFMIAFFAFGEM